MQIQDLSDIQLVPARTVGMKNDDEVVKLTFRNGKKEEEVVLFQPLLCHALDLADDGLQKALDAGKETLLESARKNIKFGSILQKFFSA